MIASMDRCRSLVIVSLLLVGCGAADTSGDMLSSSSPDELNQSPGPTLPIEPGVDGASYVFALSAPGFAGRFVDPTSGDLVVSFVGTPPADAAQAIAAAGLDLPGRSVRVIGGADFGFRDLYQWKLTSYQMIGHAGVVGVSIAAEMNRLRLWVDPAARLTVLEQRVAAAGVPWDAVVVERSAAPQPN